MKLLGGAGQLKDLLGSIGMFGVAAVRFVSLAVLGILTRGEVAK